MPVQATVDKVRIKCTLDKGSIYINDVKDTKTADQMLDTVAAVLELTEGTVEKTVVEKTTSLTIV